ncbi:MAG: hypothetical protein XXXJIFNMEKO3_02990 [Candidatus Erwinia impunctatus]
MLLRWLYLSLSLRVLSVMLILFLCWLAGDRLVVFPVSQQVASIAARQQAQQRACIHALASLHQLGAARLLLAKRAVSQTLLLAHHTAVFALEELVSHSRGGKLLSWQPDRQGEVLILKLNWSQLQRVLAYLKTLAAHIEIPHLIIRQDAGDLILTITVSRPDEKE